MRLVELFSTWRWYHLIVSWIGLAVVFAVFLRLQRPLFRELSVFLPVPNSPRGLLAMVIELWRASPLLLLELALFVLVAAMVTIAWIASRLRPASVVA